MGLSLISCVHVVVFAQEEPQEIRDGLVVFFTLPPNKTQTLPNLKPSPFFLFVGKDLKPSPKIYVRFTPVAKRLQDHRQKTQVKPMNTCILTSFHYMYYGCLILKF
jgi:hypothetical protein